MLPRPQRRLRPFTSRMVLRRVHAASLIFSFRFTALYADVGRSVLSRDPWWVVHVVHPDYPNAIVVMRWNARTGQVASGWPSP